MPNRIKELREKAGMTLQQVADASGTSLQQIHKLENAERRLTDEWMRRIAAALGVHPAALLIEFSQGQHGRNETVDEVLLLEAWRLFTLAERREVADIITAIQRRKSAARPTKQKG
jgi:transcriptional regulator with XRE-family HTH domain